MSDSVDLKEFVSGFVLEADEHLHSVNRNLVATAEALKAGRPEPRAVRELYRSLHTIKGLASMVGIEPIVDISHEMESILRTADRAGGRLSDRALTLLLQGTRALEERVHGVAKNSAAPVAPAPRALLEALAVLQGVPGPVAPRAETAIDLPEEILRSLSTADREQMIQAAAIERPLYWIDFQPSPERAARGFNITSVRDRLGALGEIVKVVPRSSPQSATGISFAILFIGGATPEAVAETLGAGPEFVHRVAVATPPTVESDLLPNADTETEWMPSDHASVRVDIRRLDEALERLSDLIITKSKLGRIEAELRATGVETNELRAVLSENTRKLKRLRTAITEARMVPLAELLQRLPLVVRGLTQGADKEVNLTVQAGNSEVDKAVADKIFPAVVHLVRNAVDHAIESRAERTAAGKNEVGQLTVHCDSSSGTVLVLTISDDGRGIDRAAVARKAGLAPAENDEALLQQIATAGLSTAKDLTHTSGRGLGMDIVKRSIEKLSGSIGLSTAEGRGTVFTIKVPLSVTIVTVLSFTAGDQTFVTPVAMVDEIVDVDPERSVDAPRVSGRGPQTQLIRRRGLTIPLLNLESLLQSTVTARTPARRALIVHQATGVVAFGIDRLLGQQEVVVRPLDDLLVRRTGIAGATDLGDGQPTLVLDLASLAGTPLPQREVAL